MGLLKCYRDMKKSVGKIRKGEIHLIVIKEKDFEQGIKFVKPHCKQLKNRTKGNVDKK